MRVKTFNSWNKKIDPCLEKTVKWLLDTTSELERHPKEGHLSFAEKDLEGLTGMDWQCIYTGENKEEFFNFVEKSGLLKKEVIKTFLDALGSLDNINVFNLCPAMIQSLKEPESSRFYQRELKKFTKRGLKTLSEDLLDRETRDIFSMVFSLLIRYLHSNVEDIPVTEFSEEYKLEFLKPNVMKVFLGAFFFIFYQIAFQKTVYELFANFLNGDDKSLFKAVTVDKSFLFHDAVKDRILKAQLTGDERFFKDLGKAIADSPLKRIGQHSKTYFVLSFCWLMGLYKLNSQELYSFLESCGIIPPAYPYAFEKFIQRHIKPLYRF